MSLIERIVHELGPWSWWILGLFLLGLEILAPGSFFLWFAIAAVLVGTIALVADLSWQVNLVLFVVLSAVSLFSGRYVLRKNNREGDDPLLNRGGTRYVGREFILSEPISQGAGRLKVGDTIWRVRGPDLPAGSKVRVTSVENASLIIEAVEI